jgi:3-hydroxybutyryl-CoA dehydrogenase
MTVLVVGAGTMGQGVAQVCATSGRTVILVDRSRRQLKLAMKGIGSSLRRLAAKDRIVQRPDVILDRIHTRRADLPEPDSRIELAIEAVFEEVELKQRVLLAMERACPPTAVLATNTSGIPVTTLAAKLERPERFAGTHFFNPVPMMKVVEVIAGERTSSETLEVLTEFVRSLGKTPLQVQHDVPGFVLNRIAMAASNEAIRLVQEGVATAEDVDRGVKGAFGWRMGPLATADLIGLDVALAARAQVFEATGDPKFEPPPLLRKLVAQGHLGRKSGRGFHEYGS